MKSKRSAVACLVLILFLFTGCAARRGEAEPTALLQEIDTGGEDVSFTSQDTAFEGYLAKPTTEGMYPMVILLHGGEGFKDHHKEYADDIASQGYVVFAACWFGCADRPSMADVQATDIDAMFEYIGSQEGSDTEQRGLIGFSAGAAMTMFLISTRDDIDAAVEYYGGPAIPSGTTQIVNEQGGRELQLENINTPLLVIQGTADKETNVQSVEQLIETLEDAGKTIEVEWYEGATHSFNWADGTGKAGVTYDADATADALLHTIDFLDKYTEEK